MNDDGRSPQVTGHGEKLSRKMELAVAALLTHPTIPEAAKHTGVSEKTLWRWLRIREFKEAYREARREAVGRAVGQVQAAMAEGVEALRSVINDPQSGASARVSAARAVLDMGLKATEVEDLEARISAIENAYFKEKQ